MKRIVLLIGLVCSQMAMADFYCSEADHKCLIEDGTSFEIGRLCTGKLGHKFGPQMTDIGDELRRATKPEFQDGLATKSIFEALERNIAFVNQEYAALPANDQESYLPSERILELIWSQARQVSIQATSEAEENSLHNYHQILSELIRVVKAPLGLRQCQSQGGKVVRTGSIQK